MHSISQAIQKLDHTLTLDSYHNNQIKPFIQETARAHEKNSKTTSSNVHDEEKVEL